MGDVISFDAKKEKVNDAVSAFTFSRKPRETRIFLTLLEIFNALKVDPEAPANLINLGEVSKELAKYSVKDFAVRYGHLEDGVAQGLGWKDSSAK